jgi:Eukaryotic membrane protein family
MDSFKVFLASIATDFKHEEPKLNGKSFLSSSFSVKDEICSVILYFEKCVGLGLLQCVNSLLYTLFILPIKCIIYPTRLSIARTGVMIAVSVFLTYYLSVSRLYHDLKDQDFLKLNAIYNMIGITDQLLMSFGQKSFKNMDKSFDNFLIFLGYIILHTVHLSLALTVFEVALNSSTLNLTLVVVTAAFIELKITVFKKTDTKVLINVIYNDIIERIQLFLYMLTVICKAALTRQGNIENISKGIAIVLITSVIIDWIKHYFLIHFNNLSPTVYLEITDKMRENWKKYYLNPKPHENDKNSYSHIDPTCSVALSYKFTSLPQSCMVMVTQLLRVLTGVLYNTLSPFINCITISILVSLKFLINYIIITY